MYSRYTYAQTDASTLVDLDGHFLVTLSPGGGGALPAFLAILVAEGKTYPLASTVTPMGGPPALDQRFASAKLLEAAFPPSRPAQFVVAWTGGSSSSTVILPPARTVPPAPISNFAALQSGDGSDIAVTWRAPDTPEPATLPGSPPGSGRRFSLYVYRSATIDTLEAKDRVYAVELSGLSAKLPGTIVAPGETLYAELIDLTTHAWAIRFPLRRLAPDAPVITSQPASATIRLGGEATFAVAASGSALTYQWQLGGQPIAGATGASLLLSAVSAAAAGDYTVTVSNPGGQAVSQVATLTVVAPPVVTGNLTPISVRNGAPAGFSLAATGAALSYQWYRDGEMVPGATRATLDFAGATFTDAGAYRVVVSNAAGAVTSSDVQLEVVPVSRLANLSVRTRVGGTNGALTVGVTVGGGINPADTTPLLLRATGPTLAAFGVTEAAPAVEVALLRGADTIARNDRWSGLAEVAAASKSVGAFAFADPLSRDAALVRAVSPAGYTARVDAPDFGGIALAEIYDTTPELAVRISTHRLINVSALAPVGTGGDVLIAGFVLSGRDAKRLLIRGIGATLAVFGVEGALTDPKLDLFRSGESVATATNDNWATANAAEIGAAAAAVGAFALSPDSRDAVLLVSLPPGAYTAQVSGVNNTTGVALVEVYEVP